MKRVGNLFYKIIDMDNLRLAHEQASAKVFWRLNTNSKRLRRVFRFHSLSTDKLYGVV